MVKTKLVKFLMIDWEKDIFLIISQFHLAMAIGSPAEEKFQFFYLIDRNRPFPQLNGLLLEFDVFL